MLALFAVVVAFAAVIVAVLAQQRVSAMARRPHIDDLPTDVRGLRDEVRALRLDAEQTFRHLSTVRYDAFADMGGQMSWSLALLDDNGDGVVLTSIHGRSDARMYLKDVRAWASDQQLSPEEDQAIEVSRTQAATPDAG